MTHVVDADSPLSGMMPADMEEEDMELLVLLDGVDATTSGVLQARHANQLVPACTVLCCAMMGFACSSTWACWHATGSP